jgi:uncharacterized protein Yka (UPF0111/DUF47 family)
MIFNLLNKLKPKEDKFFLLLNELSEVVVSTSNLIFECVQAQNYEESIAYYRKIKEQELLADSVQNRIFKELNVSFITPFDREDINQLASTMDDIIDTMNSCAKRIVLYHPKKMPECATSLALFIRESSEFLSLAIGELRSYKSNPRNQIKIKKYCEKLSSVEKKSDDVYERFIIDLFENEDDAIELIKLKEIIHELERATDSAKYVGKIIKTILIKYS